jgi:hypothetical protein
MMPPDENDNVTNAAPSDTETHSIPTDSIADEDKIDVNKVALDAEAAETLPDPDQANLEAGLDELEAAGQERYPDAKPLPANEVYLSNEDGTMGGGTPVVEHEPLPEYEGQMPSIGRIVVIQDFGDEYPAIVIRATGTLISGKVFMPHQSVADIVDVQHVSQVRKSDLPRITWKWPDRV